MKKLFTFILSLITFAATSQNFTVPSEMEFAGIKLKIKENGRKLIQEDVDALTQNETYFVNKLIKVKEYFPIIEKIFVEEGLPDDFKYLIIQESAFVADAVSTSNAVGFWQFKKETGEEVGLTIDHRVDERMHIIASTRGAARYIQKNNYYFNNWLNALQAYQMGPGDALRALGDKDSGARSMTIDKDTYWYVRKFLAHKIAFEEGLRYYDPEAVSLVEYTRGNNRSLKEVAKEVGVDEDVLHNYNKWLKVKKVPGEYIVIVPIETPENIQITASKQNMVAPDFDRVQQTIYPKVVETETPFLVTINGLEGILAPKGASLAALAQQGEISVKNLLKFNELEPGAKIIEDQIYYLEKKRNKGKIYFHTAEEGESIWSISQKYGIKASKIAKFNYLEENAKPEEGMVLWLHKKRPSNLPVVYRSVIDEKEPIVASESESRDLPTSTEIFEREVDNIEADLDIESINQTIEENTNLPASETETKEEGELLNDSEPEMAKPETEVQQEAVLEEANQEEVKNDSLEDTETKPELKESDNIAKPEVGKIHKVTQGETLFSISRIYGITVEELKEWNEIDDVTNLKMDQELKILRENSQLVAEEDKSYIKHKVVSGDTMYRISRQYNVTLKELLDLNNKSTSELQIGETLLIKKNDP